MKLAVVEYVFLREDSVSNRIFSFIFFLLVSYTADFMKKVPSVYTPSVKTIYISLSAQVAEGIIFRKPPVCFLYKRFNWETERRGVF